MSTATVAYALLADTNKHGNLTQKAGRDGLLFTWPAPPGVVRGSRMARGYVAGVPIRLSNLHEAE